MLNKVELEAYLSMAGDNFGFIEDDLNIDPLKEDLDIYKLKLEKINKKEEDEYEKYLEQIKINEYYNNLYNTKGHDLVLKLLTNNPLAKEDRKILEKRKAHIRNKENVRKRRLYNVQKRRLYLYQINPYVFNIFIKKNKHGDFYYYRFYKSQRRNSRASFLKKMSNKKIRKLPLKHTPSSPGLYRKVYDYWWILY